MSIRDLILSGYQSDIIFNRFTKSPISSSWINIAFGGGVFVAVSHDRGKVVCSNDGGDSWIPYPTTNPDPSWQCIAFGDGVFVMVSYADGTASATSSDYGKTWTLRKNLPGFGGNHGLAFGDGVFVVVKLYTDVCAYSNDYGVTWNQSKLPGGPMLWSAVAYGDGTFVTVAHSVQVVYGGSNVAAYSTDKGVTWANANLPFVANWRSVAYGDGTFVAIPDDGSDRVAYSKDGGKTWAAAQLPMPYHGWDIAYGNGQFVITGQGNYFVISSDGGVTWGLGVLTENTSASYSASAFGDNKIIVVPGNVSDLFLNIEV